MANLINKYKIGLSVFLGTIFIVIGSYAPTLSLLLLTEKEINMGTMNWAFIGLGIVFLWGRIVNIAKTLTSIIVKKVEKS